MFQDNDFQEAYAATVGVDLVARTININGRLVRMQIVSFFVQQRGQYVQ